MAQSTRHQALLTLAEDDAVIQAIADARDGRPTYHALYVAAQDTTDPVYRLLVTYTPTVLMRARFRFEEEIRYRFSAMVADAIINHRSQVLHNIREALRTEDG